MRGTKRLNPLFRYTRPVGYSINNESVVRWLHRGLFRYFHCDYFCSWQCRSSPTLPSQNAYRGPSMVISKKIFQHYGTSRGQMAFTTKYPKFLFFLLHLFLVPFEDTILTEPMPKSVQW